MGQIMLIRHAKSSWDNLLLNDHDRPLNKRGQTDAPKVAKEIATLNRIPDFVLCSTSRRTRETLNAMLEAWGLTSIPTLYREDLYHASASHILTVLKEFAENRKRIALLGHNPGITEAANRLGASFLNNLPTCGVIEFSAEALYTPYAPLFRLFPKSLN